MTATMPANRVVASEPVPEDLIHEIGGSGHAHWGESQLRLESGDLGDCAEPSRAGHCPPWLDVAVVPRMTSSPADRRVLLDRGFPWITVGRVTVGDSSDVDTPHTTATGVLVGENALLTASHVAPWGRPPGRWWMRFDPGARHGLSPYGGSYVERFVGTHHDGSRVTGQDIAVCKLYRPLGRITGWMGVHCFADDASYSGLPLSSVGYPWPANLPVVAPFAAVNRVVTKNDGVELQTEPFTDLGWSGGPLFGWIDGGHRIVGIDSGLSDQIGLWSALESQCVFAGGRRLVSLVELALREF